MTVDVVYLLWLRGGFLGWAGVGCWGVWLGRGGWGLNGRLTGHNCYEG